MYLPKAKYKIKNSTADLVTPDGKVYVGQYIETYDGRLFAGNDISAPGPGLISLKPPVLKNPLDTIKPAVIVPTPEDYVRGYLDRYVIRIRPTKKVIEVNNLTYQNSSTLSGVERIQVKWSITGLLEDSTIKGVKVKGVKTLNNEQLIEAEKTIPQIRLIFTDLGEFYKEKVE